MRPPPDDDAPDLATVQAQIDMSMAYAQELVSSWVNPKLQPSSTARQNVEKEFEALLRRPPRLGVGAPLPEAASASTRDSARLRGRLTAGTKRARGEEGPRANAQTPSRTSERADDDDAEESRAGAITQKRRIDPFGAPSGKSKKRGKKGKFSSEGVVDGGTGGAAQPDAGGVQAMGIRPDEQQTHSPAASSLHPTYQLSPVEQPRMTAVAHAVSHLAITRSPQPSPRPDASPSMFPGPAAPAPASPGPLLNLEGPPPSVDANGAPTSPKRKRKRNKKKKKKNGTEAGEPAGDIGGDEAEVDEAEG